MVKAKISPRLKTWKEEPVVRGVDDGVGVVLTDEPAISVSFADWAEGRVKSIDSDVHARPYAFALGAVGLGFVLGRMVMKRRKATLQYDVSHFPDSPRGHTGVHIRDRARSSF